MKLFKKYFLDPPYKNCDLIKLIFSQEYILTDIQESENEIAESHISHIRYVPNAF